MYLIFADKVIICVFKTTHKTESIKYTSLTVLIIFHFSIHVLWQWGGCFFLRDQSLTDLMPLYKTMKKATFSDSEDEVCLHVYMLTLLFGWKLQRFHNFFFPKGWWGRRWRWWWWWRRHKYTGNINKKPQGNIPPEYSPLVKANQLLNIVLSPMYVLFIESSTNAAPTADSATFIQSTSMERTL